MLFAAQEAAMSSTAEVNTIQTTVRLSRAMRVALDATRLRRVRDGLRLPPSFNDLVVEALEALLESERLARRARRQGNGQAVSR